MIKYHSFTKPLDAMSNTNRLKMLTTTTGRTTDILL